MIAVPLLPEDSLIGQETPKVSTTAGPRSSAAAFAASILHASLTLMWRVGRAQE
jgi:hypothetical protein